MSAGRRNNGLRQQAVGKTGNTPHGDCITDLAETIKAYLLAGHDFRLIDHPAEQRQELIGIIAILRDELPITQGWVTIRESYLSETRLGHDASKLMALIYMQRGAILTSL